MASTPAFKTVNTGNGEQPLRVAEAIEKHTPMMQQYLRCGTMARLCGSFFPRRLILG
jgi:hypothetical protein